MKKTLNIRILFGLLFVSFFISSCYTQLAVVKHHRVVAREQQYIEDDAQEDTVYVDEQEPEQDIVIYHEYEDYPYHVTVRHRLYDPFWDDYYWDDYYYTGWYSPYDYYWHRPIVYYPGPWYYWDGYYGYGGGWYNPVYVRNFKPRNFSKGTGIRHTAARGASMGRGSRTPSVSDRSRIAKSRVSTSRNGDVRAVSIRSGRSATSVQKRGTRTATRKAVKSTRSTRGGKKYVRTKTRSSKRVSRATQSKSGTKKTVRKSRSSSSSRSSGRVKSSSGKKTRSSSNSSSGRSYRSSRSSSSSGHSVSSSRSRSSSSSSSRRSSSRSSGSSRRR